MVSHLARVEPPGKKKKERRGGETGCRVLSARAPDLLVALLGFEQLDESVAHGASAVVQVLERVVRGLVVTAGGASGGCAAAPRGGGYARAAFDATVATYLVWGGGGARERGRARRRRRRSYGRHRCLRVVRGSGRALSERLGGNLALSLSGARRCVRRERTSSTGNRKISIIKLATSCLRHVIVRYLYFARYFHTAGRTMSDSHTFI